MKIPICSIVCHYLTMKMYTQVLSTNKMNMGNKLLQLWSYNYWFYQQWFSASVQ